MRKFFNFLIGFFAGALIGGTVMLLFTPLKGSAVRARLGSSFVHIQNEVKTAAQERIQELNQQLAKMQNKPTA